MSMQYLVYIYTKKLFIVYVKLKFNCCLILLFAKFDNPDVCVCMNLLNLVYTMYFFIISVQFILYFVDSFPPH